MPKTIYVVPRTGYKIFDPRTKDFIPAAGRDVPDDVYWAALVRDGDVKVQSTDTQPADASDDVQS